MRKKLCLYHSRVDPLDRNVVVRLHYRCYEFRFRQRSKTEVAVIRLSHFRFFWVIGTIQNKLSLRNFHES